MLLTIAIPTYNNAHCIEKAIQSCINQDFHLEFEILIVNNNSSDSTKELLSKYSANVRVVTNHETVSMWENHNICMKNAKGDYVLFCHSDDYLFENALSHIFSHLHKNDFPKKYIFWGHSYFRDYYNLVKRIGFGVSQKIAGLNAIKLFANAGLTPSGTVYSKDFILQGGFMEFPNNKFAPSDQVSMLDMVLKGYSFEMTDSIFFYRSYSSTLGTDVSFSKYVLASEDAYLDLINKLNDNEKKLIVDTLISEDLSLKNKYVFAPYRKKTVFKELVRQLLRRPTILTSSFFYKTLFRCV